MVTLEISSTPQRYRRMCITATVHPNHPSRAAGGTPMLYSTVYWTVILHVVLTQAIKCNCFDLQCCVFETCWRKWHKANKSPNLQMPQRRNQKKKKTSPRLMQLFHVDLIIIRFHPATLGRSRCVTGSQPDRFFREHPCSATVPCLPLCLSSSDSHTEHCCQGYHLLILVHNFQSRLQAAAWPMVHTATESPDAHKHTNKHARRHTHGFVSGGCILWMGAPIMERGVWRTGCSLRPRRQLE